MHHAFSAVPSLAQKIVEKIAQENSNMDQLKNQEELIVEMPFFDAQKFVSNAHYLQNDLDN